MLGGWDKDILLTGVLLQAGVGRALLPASLVGEVVQPSFPGVAVGVLQDVLREPCCLSRR